MALSLSAKAFSISANSVWNSPSHNCRSAKLFSIFRCNLITKLCYTESLGHVSVIVRLLIRLRHMALCTRVQLALTCKISPLIYTVMKR